MADLVITEKVNLVSVADAIREKAGLSDAFAFPAGFVEAIAEIEAGGLSLSNCQTVITGEITPSENITETYIIHSGMLLGEVEKEVSTFFKTHVFGFVLFDVTLGSASSDFYNGIMAAYSSGLTTTLNCSYGFYRGSSGSNTAITSGGALGGICAEDGSTTFTDAKEICFQIYCSSSKMLLAGHTYQYIFFVRK